jgi:hypothetical protein
MMPGLLRRQSQRDKFTGGTIEFMGPGVWRGEIDRIIIFRKQGEIFIKICLSAMVIRNHGENTWQRILWDISKPITLPADNLGYEALSAGRVVLWDKRDPRKRGTLFPENHRESRIIKQLTSVRPEDFSL